MKELAALDDSMIFTADLRQSDRLTVQSLDE
jgi:hypothetical protein